MKKLLFTVLCAAALAGCNSRTAIPYGGTVTLSEEVLRDKIKGPSICRLRRLQWLAPPMQQTRSPSKLSELRQSW